MIINYRRLTLLNFKKMLSFIVYYFVFGDLHTVVHLLQMKYYIAKKITLNKQIYRSNVVLYKDGIDFYSLLLIRTTDTF